LQPLGKKEGLFTENYPIALVGEEILDGKYRDEKGPSEENP
jgi:hypothetical protein